MKFLPFKWFPLVWLIMVSPCQAAEQNRWINLYVGQTQQRIVNIDPAADGGDIGISWWDNDFRNQTRQKSALLQDLGKERLLRLLETSPWVDVWVR